jgi:hypothetical protein
LLLISLGAQEQSEREDMVFSEQVTGQPPQVAILSRKWVLPPIEGGGISDEVYTVMHLIEWNSHST